MVRRGLVVLLMLTACNAAVADDPVTVGGGHHVAWYAISFTLQPDATTTVSALLTGETSAHYGFLLAEWSSAGHFGTGTRFGAPKAPSVSAGGAQAGANTQPLQDDFLLDEDRFIRNRESTPVNYTYLFAAGSDQPLRLDVSTTAPGATVRSGSDGWFGSLSQFGEGTTVGTTGLAMPGLPAAGPGVALDATQEHAVATQTFGAFGLVADSAGFSIQHDGQDRAGGTLDSQILEVTMWDLASGDWRFEVPHATGSATPGQPMHGELLLLDVDPPLTMPGAPTDLVDVHLS